MNIEEFREKNYPDADWDSDVADHLAVDFAKYHVKKALEEALDNIPYGGSDEVRYEDVVGILTCYTVEDVNNYE